MRCRSLQKYRCKDFMIHKYVKMNGKIFQIMCSICIFWCLFRNIHYADQTLSASIIMLIEMYHNCLLQLENLVCFRVWELYLSEYQDLMANKKGLTYALAPKMIQAQICLKLHNRLCKRTFTLTINIIYNKFNISMMVILWFGNCIN